MIWMGFRDYGDFRGDEWLYPPQFKADCEALGIDLQTPLRQNMQERRPRWWLKLLRRFASGSKRSSATQTTLRVGENPSARRLALDQSSHAQALAYTSACGSTLNMARAFQFDGLIIA